jgi:hypothetical protein
MGMHKIQLNVLQYMVLLSSTKNRKLSNFFFWKNTQNLCGFP